MDSSSDDRSISIVILGGGFAGAQCYKHVVRHLRREAGCKCAASACSTDPALVPVDSSNGSRARHLVESAVHAVQSRLDAFADHLPPLPAHVMRSALPAPTFRSSLTREPDPTANRGRPVVAVTLVNDKPDAYYNVATPRVAVDPAVAPTRLLYPLAGLVPDAACTCGGAMWDVLPRVRVATVVEVGDARVLLREDGRETSVRADLCAVTLGSGYPMPGKVPLEWDRGAICEMLNRYKAATRAADHVLVVGSGVVGVEFVGQVKTDYPDKRVTLVGPPSHGPWGTRFNESVAKALDRKGIVHLRTRPGERLDLAASFGARPPGPPGAEPWFLPGYAPADGAARTLLLRTPGGLVALAHLDPRESILVVEATGTTSMNVPVAGYAGDPHAPALDVDPTMRVMGTRGVFAAGDVAQLPGELKAGKLAYVAMIQGALVARNLAAVARARVLFGSEAADRVKLDKWKPLPDLAVVSVGKDDGVAVLPYVGTVPLGWVVSRVFKGDGGFHSAAALYGKSLAELEEAHRVPARY
ncbi:hypothetical protein H9P43_001889 [Blastocladiella emersonii ATCC 22665]|nr:hypothetical protein H9P43_001889 [Blastocladiella emersonii ATCC 22665]